MSPDGNSEHSLSLLTFMPKITGLIHVQEHTPALERTLDSLRFCDEIIVVDDTAGEETAKLSRRFGASVRKTIPGVTPGAYAMGSRNDWVLVLRADEVLDDALRQALSDWQQADHDEPGFAFQVCEVTGEKRCNHLAEMRLVNKRKINWVGELPPNNTMALKLPGDIVRYLEESAA